jgi:uncharacterized membrane protein YidH (DUF202 family)
VPEADNDPRIYLAAERTLLAWIRTGLAMMGFESVVARVGLFLRELAGLPGRFTRSLKRFCLVRNRACGDRRLSASIGRWHYSYLLIRDSGAQ